MSDNFISEACYSGGSLPMPSIVWHGKFFIVTAAGQADVLFICLMQADGSYSWINLSQYTPI